MIFFNIGTRRTIFSPSPLIGREVGALGTAREGSGMSILNINPRRLDLIAGITYQPSLCPRKLPLQKKYKQAVVVVLR